MTKQTSSGYIDTQALFDATNGGLDIIVQYFPDAAAGEHKKNHKFKMREEKTPSASIKEVDGIWIATDFGGDGKGKNGIDICMQEEQLEFGEAIKLLAANYGVAGAKPEDVKGGFEKRDAKAKEKDGSYDFKTITPKKIPNEWLKVIFARFDEKKMDTYLKVLQQYHWTAVESFTYIKDRKALITKSTDRYPIFIIEGEGFKKIYQPMNTEKQYRFRYVGDRPKDYIFGLDNAHGQYKVMNKEYYASIASMDEQDRADNDLKEQKLPELIICSGDRDALNVAAMGYPVIWLNSESAVLTGKQYKELMKLAETLYNLPDIDATGEQQGKKLALQYLDIHTINLPEELLKRKDWRGNACKDVRDYLKYYTEYHFKDLIKVAYPLRFWDVVYTKDSSKYELNNVHLYNFLRVNGFYRMKFTQFMDEEGDYIFVHKQEDRVVKRVSWKDIKKYVNNFLEERRQPIKLRNMFFRSNQLSETSIDNLPEVEIDFISYSKEHQVLFFANKTWYVNKHGIKEYKPENTDHFVWSEKRIDKNVKKLDPMFTVTFNANQDKYEVDIKDTSCLFFKFLINSSRVHWRKELEEGQQLTADEKDEQDQHLINKMYTIGYLLHKYKDPSRAWCAMGIDYKMSDAGESHGGSGKSLVFEKALQQMLQCHYLEGRNPKLLDNPHVMEGVTEYTDYILADDCSQYFKFDQLFSSITGGVKVNPKGKRQFTIPFQFSPKIGLTNNYMLSKLDPSTERRLLYSVFGDYYHFNSNGEYEESRSPRDDFGKNLFDDFTDEEFNFFFNFMAQCLQMYLNFEKIDPPMDNVNKRNLTTQMGDAFKSWADVYFSDKLNQEVVKKTLIESFHAETKLYKWTSNKIRKSLSYWCKYHGHVLNPEAMTNSDGRIIRKIEGDSVEVVYVHTVDGPALAEGEKELPLEEF